MNDDVKWYLGRILMFVLAGMSWLSNTLDVPMPTFDTESTANATGVNTTTIKSGNLTIAVTSNSVDEEEVTTTTESYDTLEASTMYWYAWLTEVANISYTDHSVIVSRVTQFQKQLAKRISERRLPQGFEEAFNAHLVKEIKQIDTELHRCLKQAMTQKVSSSSSSRRSTPPSMKSPVEKKLSNSDRAVKLMRKSQYLKTYLRECTNEQVPGERVVAVRPVVLDRGDVETVLRRRGIVLYSHTQSESIGKRYLDLLLKYLNTGLQTSANQNESDGVYKTQVIRFKQALDTLAGKFDEMYNRQQPPEETYGTYTTGQNQFPCFVRWFMMHFGTSKVPFGFSEKETPWVHRLAQKVRNVVDNWAAHCDQVRSNVKVTETVLSEWLPTSQQ